MHRRLRSTLSCFALATAAAAQQPTSPAQVAAADSGRPPFNAADVAFMSGMIEHHAQAILIAGWAQSHGASVSVYVLCERIVVAQQDEIVAMQRWLRERHLPAPDGKPSEHAMMPGMDHHATMPGMLSAAQLAQLDSARESQFDRLFLTFMIQHHKGALTMVDQVMNAQGAMEDDLMYKFASDVAADQSAEIDRMQRMLAAMPAVTK